LLLCAGVAAWLIKARLFETTPPFEMLAEAFTSQPVTELRFPRAQYGGDVKRSRGGSRLDAPRTLLEADPRIARGVDEHPEDASWLQAKGLAEFLHRDFEEARRDLEKALLLRPGDAELEESEAMTWFELGETLGEPTDYAKAVDLFGKALRTRPDDATAQYNYALALERMQLYHESLAAWKRYLAADSSSKWAQQARRHSEEIEKKLKAQSEGSMLHIEPGDPPVMEALHTAFGPATAATSAREAARRKLDEWAANFQRDYRDDWLAQLLIDSARPGFGAAEELLYSAFENTQSGNPEAAKNYAIKARMAYQALGSEAGTARAQFELTYALQFALGMRDCLEESRRLDAMAAPHRFTWLLVQAKLEEFMALAALDETLAAQQAVRRAVQLATESSLKTLYLRGICSEALMDGTTGHSAEAMRILQSGLAEYWQGNYPAYRGYDLYRVFQTVAEDSQLTDLEFATSAESVFMISRTGERQTEAMERLALARIAFSLGRTSVGRDEIRSSTKIFESLPATSVNVFYRMNGTLDLARSNLESGDTRAALAVLQSSRAAILGPRIDGLSALYYSLLGEAQMRAGDPAATQSLGAFLRYGEKMLRSLETSADRAGYSSELETAYRRLVRLEIDQHRTDDALALWEWYKASSRQDSPAQPALTDSESWDSMLAVMRSALSQAAGAWRDVTFVTWMQMDDGAASWTLRHGSVEYSWIPLPRTTVRALASAFADACSDSQSREESVRSIARRTYDLVGAPLRAKWQDGVTVAVELDGPAATIPLEAMRTAQGSWLGDQFNFVASPGLLFVSNSPNKPDKPELRRMLAVGSPRLSDEDMARFGALPEALAEAQSVAEKFRYHTVISGDRATRAAVRRELTTADIFHFAGHAWVAPENSGLLLAGGGDNQAELWTAEDLASGSLRKCSLVVLSACSTGNIQYAMLNKPDNLVRRFLAAGAREVVASRWAVDSKATLELMSKFYGLLVEGETPAAALAGAARSLRKQSIYAHPYYWASFSVFGEDDPPSLKQNTQGAAL
jgi:CHAT domain-containing protein